ncbi:helix-turn-helix transcriptional regulator [Venenivibrio stagnispumantis]|uniref:MerR family transcriptional regulator, heat shock protein HspR n=1 Tax=Venenivibrio stagnispumantis TaxID=407998 RepID=A0AA45WL67_9AQUI|nr:helix-turn-helix transcriptional regulator [Venenivibrio stagnispumantis]MCW4573840.1 helix-turn-helix transcriptional regulator [Venenivibrio stagnispumantis]SMP10194.1 MerR family transcriptional regulator, heat shock protein HspR [Venenivibrio stagnispumantis]
MRKREDKKKEPLYMIGAVARMFNIHPQTLRLYEREGLLTPSRTQGRTRLYSQEDIERLEFILFLTRELGVNLAGVDAILRMKEQIEQLQLQIEYLIDYINEEIKKRFEEDLQAQKNALVKLPKFDIVKIEDYIYNKYKKEEGK